MIFFKAFWQSAFDSGKLERGTMQHNHPQNGVDLDLFFSLQKAFLQYALQKLLKHILKIELPDPFQLMTCYLTYLFKI